MAFCSIYNKVGGLRTGVSLDAALHAAKDPANVVWIDLAPATEQELDLLGRELGIHELILEDLKSAHGRPKIDEVDNYLLVVFKALNFGTPDDVFDTVNLAFVLFKNLLITSHLEPVAAITEFREHKLRLPTCIPHGPAFLMYQILDTVVDEYFRVLDELDELSDQVQHKIFERFDPSISESIFAWKSRVAHLRRGVGPQREILAKLANQPHPLIPPKTQIYFRDVYDHVIRINDNLESYRDILQSAMDSYMSQVSNRMNAIMKQLSIVATIVLPLNVLTGLYGTNFKTLPGAGSPYSFWIFIAVLAAMGVATYLLFRRTRLL